MVDEAFEEEKERKKEKDKEEKKKGKQMGCVSLRGSNRKKKNALWVGSY